MLIHSIIGSSKVRICQYSGSWYFDCGPLLFTVLVLEGYNLSHVNNKGHLYRLFLLLRFVDVRVLFFLKKIERKLEPNSSTTLPLTMHSQSRFCAQWFLKILKNLQSKLVFTLQEIWFNFAHRSSLFDKTPTKPFLFIHFRIKIIEQPSYLVNKEKQILVFHTNFSFANLD